MPAKWGGFDLKQFSDPAVRDQMKRLDFFLKQLNANVANITSPSTSTTVVGIAAHASSHLPSGSDAITVSAPVAVGTANSAGTANSLVRSDHVHDASALLPRDGSRDMTGELGSDVGTFRSDVASGGTGFIFNTANTFSSGELFSFRNNTTEHADCSFEGHWRLGNPLAGTQTQNTFSVGRTLSGDNRSALNGANISSTIGGTITGAVYSPTLRGVACTMTFNPTSFPSVGSRIIEGGKFAAANSAAATGTVQTLRGGFFQSDLTSTTTSAVSTAIGGDFQINGSGAGITQAYIMRSQEGPSSGFTDLWGLWAFHKIGCKASDFQALASGKGYINRDSQSASAGGGGTARYWRAYVDASATGTAGDVTIAIDSAGALTATRAGGATGTVLFKLIDVGTSAPTS